MTANRKLARALVTIVGLAFAALAGAQAWPAKPVQIIAPTNVGSGPDLLARILGAKLAERWGQQVVIVNKLGAGTMIGTAEVAKSAPDGYNMVLVPDAFANNPALIKLPFDPIKDLTPVAQVALGAMVLCVHPSMPVSSVAEFVDYVKKNPKKVAYGSAGTAPRTTCSWRCSPTLPVSTWSTCRTGVGRARCRTIWSRAG